MMWVIPAIILATIVTLLIIFIEPDDGLGDKSKGGVQICGVNHNCGVEDNICPEDYGAICKIADIDCCQKDANCVIEDNECRCST